MPKSFDTWECAAVGCEKQIDTRLLMCKPHWYMVPAADRKVIMATWITGPMTEYQAAKRRAIEAVAAREEKSA